MGCNKKRNMKTGASRLERKEGLRTNAISSNSRGVSFDQSGFLLFEFGMKGELAGSSFGFRLKT
jgi:hypothetical protein